MIEYAAVDGKLSATPVAQVDRPVIAEPGGRFAGLRVQRDQPAVGRAEHDARRRTALSPGQYETPRSSRRRDFGSNFQISLPLSAPLRRFSAPAWRST